MPPTDISTKLISVTIIVAALIIVSQMPTGAVANDRVDAKVAERQLNDRDRRRGRRKAQPNLRGTAGTSAADTRDGGATFVLKSIKISGASAISAADLAKTYQPYIGRLVSETDLGRIAHSITELYQSSGYLLSRAYIPPQDIGGGAVQLSVLEGHIESVLFKGGRASQFGLGKFATHLSRESPLTRKTFERQLLLINDTPGVQVEDTTLREVGNATGRFELTIFVKTWRAWGQIGMDNRGSEDVGPIQGYASAAANSVLSPGGTVAVDISTIPDETREMSFGRLSIEQPIGDQGAKLGLAASSSRLLPSGESRSRNTKIRTNNISLKGTIVGHRSRKASLWISLEGSTGLDQERDETGLVYRDRIHALSLLADIQLRDHFGGMNYITFKMRRGFSMLGASRAGDQDLSRIDGNGEFTKLFASFYRSQTWQDNWSLALSGQAQTSSYALLSSEEFYLGGSSIGRAFESGAISGDSGLGGVAELRYEQQTDRPLLKRWMVYGFVDGGAVWNRDSTIGSPLALASYGTGLWLELPRDIRVGFELAKPFQAYSWAENGDDIKASVSLSHSTKF